MNFGKIIKSPKRYFNIAFKKIKNQFRVYFYKGDNVFCDICKWNGKLFFNENCPNCNSLSRTRLIPFSLKYFKLIKKNLKILHIGPNINEYNYVKENFEELSYYDRLDIKKRKHTNITQSIVNTDLDSDIYDLVIAWHVFEHIKDDLSAISEIYRVLKPKGQALVCVPIYPVDNQITFEDIDIIYEDYHKIYGHHDHCRSCGLDYYKRFESKGFKTQVLDLKITNKATLEKHGLNKEHIVWCFNKL